MSRNADLGQHLKNGDDVIVIDDFFVEIFQAEFPIPIFQQNVKIIKNYPASVFYGKNRGDLVREEMLKGEPLSKTDLLCEENTKKLRLLLSSNAAELESGLTLFKSESKKRLSESKAFSEKFIRGLAGKVARLDIKQYKHAPKLLERHIYEISMSVLELSLRSWHGESFEMEKFQSKKSVSYIQNYILLWRVIDWAQKKGYQNAKKIDHDNFDLKYVLTSCFFDGLFSKEQWMNDCRDSVLSSVNHMVSSEENCKHLVR